jgi:hypothetical protein
LAFESMKPWHFIATAILALVATQSVLARTLSSADDDRAVWAAALQAFWKWDDVTFGKLKGVLAVEPNSYAYPNLTAKSVRDMAPQIQKNVSDQLCNAYAARNHTSVPIYTLIKGMTGFQKYDPSQDPHIPSLRPIGAKAIGSVGLPAYSTDGKTALLEIEHSWSIHGAVVTFVLKKERGIWRVVARDQRVFL